MSIAAFAFGVEMAPQPPFDPPVGLSLIPRGSLRPGRQVGVVEVEWQLRPRYRTGDDRLAPSGAVIGRLDSTSQRFLNPDNPDPALKTIPQPILPAADADTAGGGGTRVVDRSAALNTPLEYRVAECDPFGRWSTWTSATTRVEHHALPDPVPCEVLLEESSSMPGAYQLTVRFDWDPAATWDGGLVSGAPSQMSFAVSVRRTLPPAAGLRDRAAWATLERQAGTGAGAFTVAGATGALTTAHDGMTVLVEQPVTVVVDSRQLLRYGVRIDGLRLAPSTGGRVRCYAAVVTTHVTEGPSAGAGVPALAEHIPTTPPSVPVMPPDPLWSSLPDAENRSTVPLTFTVPDDAAATAVRYQILRAGENDVVSAAMARVLPSGDPRFTARAMAHADYLAATTLAQRADALKRLAVLAEDVFAIAADRTPAPAAGAPATVVCELTASLRTLTLFCARTSNQSSQRRNSGSVTTWRLPTGKASQWRRSGRCSNAPKPVTTNCSCSTTPTRTATASPGPSPRKPAGCPATRSTSPTSA